MFNATQHRVSNCTCTVCCRALCLSVCYSQLECSTALWHIQHSTGLLIKLLCTRTAADHQAHLTLLLQTMCVAHGASNASFVHLNYTTQTLFKSSKVFFVMLGGYDSNNIFAMV